MKKNLLTTTELDKNSMPVKCCRATPDKPPPILKLDKTSYDQEGFDFVIMCMSRITQLTTCVESLRKHLKYSKVPVRFYLWNGYYKENPDKGLVFNDNMYGVAAANKCIDLVRNHGFTNWVSAEAENSLGYAMTNAMNAFVRSKYMITLLDDGELIKDVDLDLIYDCLEQNSKINMVSLRPGGPYPTNVSVPVTINGTNYTFPGSKHIYFAGLSVWRMSFFSKVWVGTYRNVHWELNKSMVDVPDLPTLRKEYVRPEKFFTEWTVEYQKRQDYTGHVLGVIAWMLDPVKNYVRHSNESSVRNVIGL